MKQEAKAKLSEKVDIVQNKEFWRIAKSLVELSAPSMNPRRLRLADSDIQGTGKVYHDMFKPWTEKFLETMSIEYDFTPKAGCHLCKLDASYIEQGIVLSLDPEFHSHDNLQMQRLCHC